MKIRPITALFAVLAALAGTARGDGDAAPAPITQGDYRLQAGDVIKMQVFQVPELDREVRVSQQGEVVLPLIGRLIVKGRPLSLVEQTVRMLYDRDYLVNPQINMMVTTYSQQTVNVMGAVNTPQAVSCPPDKPLSLLDAISRSGGFNRFANRKAVRLTRTDADGHTTDYTINADELISGGKSDKWILVSGDVIYVPESIL